MINALISLNIHAINEKVPVPVPVPAGFIFKIPVPVRFRPELKYRFRCIPIRNSLTTRPIRLIPFIESTKIILI